ncbi:MAG: V-type ATPase subunit [Candidatus Nanohalobium sp.]
MSARVSAKKDKLLNQSDYENLLKMQPNEIARRLEEGEYQDDIDELGSKYEGARLVELALTRNLSRTLSDLVDMSPETLQRIIKVYLRRYDILSLKRLLRWKRSGQKGSIQDLMTPVGSYSYGELKELADKDQKEIINSIRFRDSEVDYSKHLEGKQEISEIETALDQAYFDELGLLADEISNKDLKDFIQDEMEFQNISIVLRLKKYGISDEEIRKRILEIKNGKIVEKVITAQDFEQAIEVVKNSGLLPEKASEDLEDIEHEMEIERLRKALITFHTEPLGITPIIGYIVAKITEVRNLRMLIRAKETGIQNNDTIRRNLVMEHR